MEETASKNGVIHYSNVNTYDKYGESINYVPDPGEEKLFDKNGNLVKVFYPGLEGLTSAFSIAYDYDYFDRKVRETHYDSLDNITNMEMFYYDDKGGVIQADKIDKNRIATQLLAGDEYGYPIERIYLPFNDSIGSFIYNWENKDRYGNIIKQAWIQRDENGNLLEDVRTTDFTYDKMGNWINKKVFRNDTLEFIYERQIIYY